MGSPFSGSQSCARPHVLRSAVVGSWGCPHGPRLHESADRIQGWVRADNGKARTHAARRSVPEMKAACNGSALAIDVMECCGVSRTPERGAPQLRRSRASASVGAR